MEALRIAIRKRVEIIRLALAPLIVDDTNTYSPLLDKQINKALIIQLAHFCDDYDAAVWHPAIDPPAKWRIVLVAVKYGRSKKAQTVLTGEYSMGTWLVFDHQGSYRPARRGETILGWRDMPRYITPTLEGK